MTKVTIVLEDTGETDVRAHMTVDGHKPADAVEFTTAVLFGETIMRAVADEGLWLMAQELVPEAFENA